VGPFQSLIGKVLAPRDEPAWPLVARARPVGALPSKAFVQLSSPHYQADASSCLAHAVLGALESHVVARTGAVLELNRLDAYFGARWLAGDWPRDVGSYPDKMAEWLRNHGTVSEVLQPYDPKLVGTWIPPASWAPDRRLLTADLQPLPRSIEQIKAELAEDRAVVLCHHVDRQMAGVGPNDAGRTGIEVGMTGPSLGGHARCIVGYDDAVNRFLVWNSWRGWGNRHPSDPAFPDSFSWVPYLVAVDPAFCFYLQRIARGLDVEI
jgi:C1A family cysteine protease